MAAKKCCCCSLFSCFSTQTDLSEIIANPSPSVPFTGEESHVKPSGTAVDTRNEIIANPSPSVPVPGEESHVKPSGTAVDTRNALEDILAHDPQPIYLSTVAPSQANTSKVGPVMKNDSQLIAPSAGAPSSPALPTSSQNIVSPPTHPAPNKVFEVGSSSTPSSTNLTKEDRAKNIREAADALDKENVDIDFNDLSNYISQFLDFIEEKKKGNNPSKPKAAGYHWPGSKSVFKLREVLSEGINVVKDVCPDVKTIAHGFLKGMGAAHMATTGLLVVANILERYEAISTNAEACLSLLKKMNILARHVTELQKRPELKEGMEDSIREAIVLIVEASIACCTQIDATKFSKFFSTAVDGGKLDNFKTMLTDTDAHMQKQMNLCIYDAIVRPRKERELLYPQKPKDAVGIEDPLEAIIERLEWGSDKNALAVIVHGFGGMGKTTLADAVFARLFDANLEGCKYSFVRLFEDIATKPDIMGLQKCILRDLKMGEEPKEIRRFEEGRQQIGHMLEKEIAFIYIDNILLPDKVEEGRDALKQLLPKDMGNAKKLRLLLTARDKNAVRIRGVKQEFYPIEILPETEAVKLFKKTLDDNEKQLKPSQMNQIVKICGGVPKLLTVVAGFISSEENLQIAYKTVMEESKNNWKGEIGKEIECYVFAYEKLDETLRDPFLDICSFFQGWNWEALSNIVGESELKRLERRALVTKDVKSMTARVHDVILSIGLEKTKGERFRFTTASEIEEFFNQKKDEDLLKIKGIWSSYETNPFYVPASKLDLMSRLRVLKLGRLTYVEGKCEFVFKEMVFFSARISHLPFDVSKLKEFEKLSHLCYEPEDLQNLSQMPSYLRHIEFNLRESHDFQISSNCIEQLSNLRVLRLKSSNLKMLPQDLGDVVNGLQELTLFNCYNLKELPGSISRLESLRVLKMQSCYSLRQLPSDFGSLSSLQELDLGYCKSVEALPSSLGKLKSLQELDLGNCESLEALPSSLEELSSLRLLDLSGCKSLKGLPYGLGNLTSLAKLNLKGCEKLSSIPESICQLKLLASIDFSGTDLKELPDGFCNLSFITELEMNGRGRLKNLPMIGWNRLEKLPDRFGELTSLRKLSLVFCYTLKKLPESFSQLKFLEELKLSFCDSLEELCTNFRGLSSLQVLSLNYCIMLVKLPEDFHCLTSLEVLDLIGCDMLEGKSMDNMVKIKTLQTVDIAWSKLLEERWGEIQRQCDQSESFAVHTEEGLSNKENIVKQLQSKFESIITNGRGDAFHISDLPLNTVLLVMIDGRDEFHEDADGPDEFHEDADLLSFIEENIDDIQTNFGILYFGKHFNKLHKKVADKILGHAPANMDALALFRKVLLVVDVRMDLDGCFNSGSFQMAFNLKVVSDEKDHKYLSHWEHLDDRDVEYFVLHNCRGYLKLKQLVEIPRESNIDLLRELFAIGKEESSLGFLQMGTPTKIRVNELRGKTILLDYRYDDICYDIPLQALVEMYVAEKDRFDFEIITIPRAKRSTGLHGPEKLSRKVPWLVLPYPWTLTKSCEIFLSEMLFSHHGKVTWYPNSMMVIESNGTIPAHDPRRVSHMVNTWGTEAYPFTEEKIKELIEKEVKQMKAMSNLMFLFKHLESVSEQVKKAMRQQKMIWLYSCREEEFTNSIKNVLIELRDSVYLIYIPIFGFFQQLKMSQAEMQGMFLLNDHESIRFWSLVESLTEAINKIDDKDNQFNKMVSFLNCISRNGGGPYTYSWMAIVDEDGNFITIEWDEFVELLSNEHTNDKAKELMQEVVKVAKAKSEGDSGGDVDSEGDLP